MRIKEQTSKDWHKAQPSFLRRKCRGRGQTPLCINVTNKVFTSSSSSSSLFECCYANAVVQSTQRNNAELAGLHLIVCWSNILDLGVSPLALRCARPLTLSPLAKVCLGVSLTCDSTITHTHTVMPDVLRTGWGDLWPLPPLLPSHSHWFLLLFSFISPPPSPS